MASDTKATAPVQESDEHGLEIGQNTDAEKVAVALPPLTAGHSSDGLDDSTRQKLNNVFAACRDRDIDALRALATSDGGLIDDDARRAACTSIT